MSKKMEEQIDLDFQETLVEVEKPQQKTTIKRHKQEVKSEESELINCLSNERIVVRYIPKNGMWGNNPKHVLAGGMAEGAVRVFTVPKLSSGIFVNILTSAEKDYLEYIMQLEPNELSIYKKQDNFWDDSNENGISTVRLTKTDNYLDLSDPEDYIRYKILLANKDFIAPSLETLQDYPKATYQFVIIKEKEETKIAKRKMSATMECYKEFGKIEEDKETLRVIIETIEGKPTAPNSKLEFLQTKANDLIQLDSKLFLKVIKDNLLSTKVLIKKAIEAGIISLRGNFLYLRKDNTPLCEHGEEPTLNIAAKYLSSPKRQDIKFAIEANLKTTEK